MGWLSKLFNLDLWTEQNLGAVPNPVPQETTDDKAEAHGSAGARSKADAKNRLKLVLMHDRTQLSSEVLEKMRGEIVEVISKYVEIDTDALEINLESESNTIALVANIPMMKMRAAQGKAEKTEAETADAKGKAEVHGSTGALSKGSEEESKKPEDDAAEDLIEAVEASEKAEGKPPAKKAGQ